MDLRKAAQIVANHANTTEETEVFIDPLTLSLVASVLGALFQAARLYCEVKNGQSTAERIQEVCKNPSLVHKHMVRARIYTLHEGRLTYRQRVDLSEYILEVGATSNLHDIEQLVGNEQGEYGEWEV